MNIPERRSLAPSVTTSADVSWPSVFWRELALQDWIALVYLFLLFAVTLVGDGPRRPTALVYLTLDITVFMVAIGLARGKILTGTVGALAYRIGLFAAIFGSFSHLQYILPTARAAIHGSVVDADLYAFDKAVFGFEPAEVFDGFVTTSTVEWFSFFYFGYFFILAAHIFPAMFLAKNTRLDRRVVDAVVRAMRDEYASRGYGAAKVDFEIEPAGPGDVRVRFAVTEGPRWKLSKLSFPGAKKISEADLRKATELEEGAPVDLERVERAKFMLARAYHDRGMIMSRIGEPKREVAADGATVISWTIDEGDVYRIGTIRFAKLGEKLQKELTAETKARPKETFNHAQLNEDLERIKAWFRARGQTVMAVLAIKADDRKKTVDLEIDVTEIR